MIYITGFFVSLRFNESPLLLLISKTIRHRADILYLSFIRWKHFFAYMLHSLNSLFVSLNGLHFFITVCFLGIKNIQKYGRIRLRGPHINKQVFHNNANLVAIEPWHAILIMILKLFVFMFLAEINISLLENKKI